MWLQELEADRLRNLRAVSLRPAAGLTIVQGRNGQGKTSLLEAIYLLGTGRSFRTRRQDELPAWDGGPMRVAGRLEGRLGQTRLSVVIDGTRRALVADGIEKDLEGFLGRLDVVDLTAERMNVVRGAPVERRRFLDRGVVSLDPTFLRVLGEYRRTLQQRNATLRGGAGGRATQEVWEERLATAAAALHARRRRYAVTLAARLAPIARAILGADREVVLRYAPSPADAREAPAAGYADRLQEALAAGRERDRGLGHTLVGPHRDDLRIELDGVDLRRFGSAGQIRAAMVVLKVGKLSILQEERGESPLFLMDDFDSDLDEARSSALAGFLHDGGFQAFIATSKEALVRSLGVPTAKVRMDAGTAQEA